MARTPRVWSSVEGPLDIDISGVSNFTFQAVLGYDYDDLAGLIGIVGDTGKLYCGFFDASDNMEVGLRLLTQDVISGGTPPYIVFSAYDESGRYFQLGAPSAVSGVYSYYKSQFVYVRHNLSGPGGQPKYAEITPSSWQWFRTQPSFDPTIGYIRLGQFGLDDSANFMDALYTVTGVVPGGAGENPTVTASHFGNLGTVFTAAAGTVCSGAQLRAQAPAQPTTVQLWEASGSASPIATSARSVYTGTWNEVYWANGPVVLSGGTYYITWWRQFSGNTGKKTGTWPRSSIGGGGISGTGGIISSTGTVGTKPSVTTTDDFLIGPICNRVTGGVAVPTYFDYINVQDLDGPSTVYFTDFDRSEEPDHGGAVEDPFVDQVPQSFETIMGELGGGAWPTTDHGTGGFWTERYGDPGTLVYLNAAGDRLVCELPAGNAELYSAVGIGYERSDYDAVTQPETNMYGYWQDDYAYTLGIEVQSVTMGDFDGDPPTISVDLITRDASGGLSQSFPSFEITEDAVNPDGLAINVSLPAGYWVGDPAVYPPWPYGDYYPFELDTHYLIRISFTDSTGLWLAEMSDDEGSSWTTIAQTPSDNPSRTTYPVYMRLAQYGRNAPDDGWKMLLDWKPPDGMVSMVAMI